MSFKHMTYADWTYVADISFITYIVIIIFYLFSGKTFIDQWAHSISSELCERNGNVYGQLVK